ncbi:MAG TPA: sulfotransferase [Bacillales bacterium]|nr:sulfotransferase [Bacillales bacterium]
MDLLISSATHRSGSTLIQRIFNARARTLIWGENGGCLTDYCHIYNNALHYSETFKDVRNAYFNEGQNPNQWIACMTPRPEILRKAVIQSIKTLNDQLYVDEHRDAFDMIGYKEVRYGKEELELFRECYPGCPVILLIRHPVSVWKSVSPRAKKERYGSFQGFSELWTNRVEEYLDLSAKDPDMHLIKYEDVIAKETKTLDLIKSIGSLKDDEIEKVLAVRVSSSSKPIHRGVNKGILKLCENTMIKAGYDVC